MSALLSKTNLLLLSSVDKSSNAIRRKTAAYCLPTIFLSAPNGIVLFLPQDETKLKHTLADGLVYINTLRNQNQNALLFIFPKRGCFSSISACRCTGFGICNSMSLRERERERERGITSPVYSSAETVFSQSAGRQPAAAATTSKRRFYT